MSATALRIFRLTALGTYRHIPKSAAVNPLNLTAYYHVCSRSASSTLTNAWYNPNERYSYQRSPKWHTAYLSLNGVVVRPFSNGSFGKTQKQQTPNEKQQDVASSSPTEQPEDAVPEKLGLFARFKKMYKEYWYVLVPVHCLTSVMWFGGFYYASTSGVDVIAILESLGVSETLINPVRDSSLGHIAIAYLLYKIATPARYTVTLGGTTISIKYLEQWGYIKPIPSKARLVQMYKDKKENIQEKIAEKKQDFKDRKQQLTEKKNTLMSDLKMKDGEGKSTAPPGTSSVTDSK
uniref:DUF1279 domain-containing protein n=1 Tax=Anopheles farauti TaxID=69004 RepID=A0A182QBP3_9DIPT